jgi:hypothetical protein
MVSRQDPGWRLEKFEKRLNFEANVSNPQKTINPPNKQDER